MSEPKLRARLRYASESLRYKFHRRHIYVFLILSLLTIVFFGSFIILVFERRTNPTIDTYGDALWLMFVTLATVGYGDTVPVTAGGRIACVVSMVLGIGLLSAFITTKATSMADKMRRRRRGLDKSVKSRDHFVVCGWNGRGSYTLSTLKAEVEKDRTPIILLCDLEENPVDDDYVFFVRGNPVDEVDLRRVNVGEARSVILLADETRAGADSDIDARTVLAAMTIRSINPEMPMTAEVLVPENVHHLEVAGVREIMDSNVIAGSLMARSALHFGLIGIVSEFITTGVEGRFRRVTVDDEMADMEYGRMIESLKEEYGPGTTVAGVRTEGGFRPEGEFDGVSPGDELIIPGFPILNHKGDSPRTA